MKLLKIVAPCWIIIALLCVLLGCIKPEHGMVGSRAPEFTLTGLNGERMSLPELAGKPVLLEFWTPWCPACRENIDPLKEIYRRFAGKIHIIASQIQAIHPSTQAVSICSR